MTPRLVFGVPLYNAAEHLPTALDSLLAQTLEEIALVLVDDQSSDATEEISRGYAARDPRVTYHRNEKRLGLTRNWRRAFELATEQYPEAELFAWGSDHDVWDPRFADELVDALVEVPAASVAYPDDAVIREDGVKRRRPTIDTSGIYRLRRLLAVTARRMRAGQMVYGVFRVPVLRKAGGFRHLLFADRLVLVEAAVQGPIVRVPQVLMQKRSTATFGVDRQRRACFPDGVPVWARLPWWLVHAAVLAWVLGVRGRGRPRVGRLKGFGVALLYAYENTVTVIAGRRRAAAKARRGRTNKGGASGKKQPAGS